MTQVHHFIDTQELGPDVLRRQFELIAALKDADKAGAMPRLLEGASLGMIFEEPSTRTRVSFEVAMTKLGGHALYLKPGEIHLGERESLGDTAQVLSRMCDVLELRALSHATVLELAKYATVPVLNGLTDYNHPTQSVCDAFTMLEHSEPGIGFADLTVVFVGDATNVCTSTALIVTMLGGTFVHARPERYSIGAQWPQVLPQVADNCARYGGRFIETEDVREAVRTADYVYTDLWWWVGQEAEIPDRRAAFMPKYQVNADLMALAPTSAKFMHCLPASRGVEATDDVMDSPASIIFDQAENRLHTQKGLLVWYALPHVVRSTQQARDDAAQKVAEILAAPLTPLASSVTASPRES
jgi:putrescine carbamoyltransferase